jgi:YggT family protein
VHPTIVGSTLALILWLFFVLLIARLVLDYIQMFARSWRPSGLVLVAAEVVYTITDPPLKALRRVIPPLRIGSVSLDLSFLVLVVLLQIAIYLTTFIPF